jgi:hypothetical protein
MLVTSARVYFKDEGSDFSGGPEMNYQELASILMKTAMFSRSTFTLPGF